jgi:hypothetical protein
MEGMLENLPLPERRNRFCALWYRRVNIINNNNTYVSQNIWKKEI